MKLLVVLTIFFLPLVTTTNAITGKYCLKDANGAALYLDTREERWTFCQEGRPSWQGTGLEIRRDGVKLTANHDRPELGQSLATELDLYERTHRTLLQPPNSTRYQFYGELYPVTAREDCTCQQ